MTLKEFSDQILKPSLIRSIKNGDVDNALADPDCLEIIYTDEDLLKAYNYRMEKTKND